MKRPHTIADDATDDAIATAEAHADPAWVAAAYDALEHLIWRGQAFTSDDAWNLLIGWEVPMPREKRALGPVIRTAARQGLIEATGRFWNTERKVAHRKPTREWRVVRRDFIDRPKPKRER